MTESVLETHPPALPQLLRQCLQSSRRHSHGHRGNGGLTREGPGKWLQFGVRLNPCGPVSRPNLDTAFPEASLVLTSSRYPGHREMWAVTLALRSHHPPIPARPRSLTAGAPEKHLEERGKYFR